ncbi:MAG: hypothetical protein KatS3mg032_0146 [Cyclobacteriaceae bacterium]|nr:MAG: hypothetical protein KatS3mg032_0146 [Cyclobacteriaceae bacterium]
MCFTSLTNRRFFHNEVLYQKARIAQPDKLAHLESKYDSLFSLKHAETLKLVQAIENRDDNAIAQYRMRVREMEQAEKALREEVRSLVAMAVPGAKTQDRDYIFLNFVLHYLPHGVVGPAAGRYVFGGHVIGRR